MSLSDSAPGRVQKNHPETSHAAAYAIAPVTGKQRLAVLAAFREKYELTDDELRRVSGVERARTRRQELIEVHGIQIVDSGKRRRSDMGHPSVVWMLRDRPLPETQLRLSL